LVAIQGPNINTDTRKTVAKTCFFNNVPYVVLSQSFGEHNNNNCRCRYWVHGQTTIVDSKQKGLSANNTRVEAHSNSNSNSNSNNDNDKTIMRRHDKTIMRRRRRMGPLSTTTTTTTVTNKDKSTATTINQRRGEDCHCGETCIYGWSRFHRGLCQPMRRRHGGQRIIVDSTQQHKGPLSAQ
jgi:hypothetical protein